MAETLPERPDLNWLRKRAKAERAEHGSLAKAQLAVARRYGFASWRALVAHVEAVKARAATPKPLPEALVDEFLLRVGEGKLDEVAALLRDTPALVNAIGPHPFWGGRPQPLHVAIETNRFPMVKLLLAAGADVNGTNHEYSHWSPLLLALDPKRGRSKRALLERGAKIGIVEALAMGDDERALRMLRRGRAALPEHVPGDGSLLMWARTPAAIDRLLALGVATDARDKWGTSPMEAFSRKGKQGALLVRHLAARGVPVDAEAYARLGDRRSLARMILADPSIATRPTVVKFAVDFGHRALVGWLLDRGADPNARSVDRISHDTCLHSAAWNGDLAMVELLLAHGADPTLLDDEHHNTPAGFADVAVKVTNNPTCAQVAERLRRAIAARHGLH